MSMSWPVLSDEQPRALPLTTKGRDFVDVRDTAIIRLLVDAGIRRAEFSAWVAPEEPVQRPVSLGEVEGAGRTSGFRDRWVTSWSMARLQASIVLGDGSAHRERTKR
ncbi:MAG: hypothetical protein ACRDYA_09325 [Egibacteraceae bacterium]